MIGALYHRAVVAGQRRAANWLSRRLFNLRAGQPVVSFSFDDFPLSALETGGSLLAERGFRGTYYTALGLAGTIGESGPHFSLRDIRRLVDLGHELGCHTFAHCNAWSTRPAEFEASVLLNASALREYVPGSRFETHSYPISHPRPETKRRLSRHFSCCRGGGQRHNVGVVDLNYLASFFIEQAHGDIRPVKDAIDANRDEGGWLIFSTHDVDTSPSRFGCTPAFFENVVAYAAASGALILPVHAAWKHIRSRTH